MQVKNSGPHSEHQEHSVRAGHCLCTSITRVLGWRTLQFFWTAFDSCNSPFFKGVNWQQKNGWYFGISI